MGERWRTADGQWCVDAIRLSATPDRRDGEWLRVRWLGYWKADVRTVAELARLVPLDWLQEAPLLVRAARFWLEYPVTWAALTTYSGTGYGAGYEKGQCADLGAPRVTEPRRPGAS